MSNSQSSWQLKLGNELIATIGFRSYEFSWTYGELIKSPAFERFRIYFSDEDMWPETPEFDALCQEVEDKGGFILAEMSTGETFRNIRLNHKGAYVWFRYS